MIEGEPAHCDVIGTDGEGVPDGADIGEDVGMGEEHALGLARAPRGVLDQRGGASAERERGRTGAARGEPLHGGHVPERRDAPAQEPPQALHAGEGDQEADLGVPQDAGLAARVLLDAVHAKGRIDRDGDAPRQERAEEGLEEGGFRSQHEPHRLAPRDAVLGQAGGHAVGPLEQAPVRDGLLRVALVAEEDVDARGVRLGVAAQHVHEGGGAGGHAGRRRERRKRFVDALGDGGRSAHNRPGQVARRLGLRHHGIGKPHAEGLLEAQQELDALEAADAEIAIEEVVQTGGTMGGKRAELGDQCADEAEDALLHGLRGGTPDVPGRHRPFSSGPGAGWSASGLRLAPAEPLGTATLADPPMQGWCPAPAPS